MNETALDMTICRSTKARSDDDRCTKYPVAVSTGVSKAASKPRKSLCKV